MACQPIHSPTALVKIQDDEKIHVFELSREKLCSTSVFFNKALRGKFLEATTGIVHIEEVPADLFSAFAGWISTGQLEFCHLEDLVELYVFADMFDVPGLRATIIAKLTVVCFKLDFAVPD